MRPLAVHESFCVNNVAFGLSAGHATGTTTTNAWAGISAGSAPKVRAKVIH